MTEAIRHGTALRPVVIDLATLIDGDQGIAEDWYARVPIAELGGMTAEELVSLGKGSEVLGFLVRVVAMYRA